MGCSELHYSLSTFFVPNQYSLSDMLSSFQKHSISLKSCYILLFQLWIYKCKNYIFFLCLGIQYTDVPQQGSLWGHSIPLQWNMHHNEMTNVTAVRWQILMIWHVHMLSLCFLPDAHYQIKNCFTVIRPQVTNNLTHADPILVPNIQQTVVNWTIYMCYASNCIYMSIVYTIRQQVFGL